MNTKITSLCATLLLSTAMWLHADEAAKPKAASAEFERMKTLVGSWTGKADIGQGPIDMTVQYRLIAAGSVLEERVFAGTPNEMVTMFYDKDGKLALTHYCMMGNRPAMTLQSSDEKSLSFAFDGANYSIDAKKECHMNAMTLRFNDADTLTSSCKALMDGKEMPEHPVTLKRVKTAPTASN